LDEGVKYPTMETSLLAWDFLWTALAAKGGKQAEEWEQQRKTTQLN